MPQEKSDNIITNQKIVQTKLTRAKKIISKLYDELPNYIAHGHGPFLAAIYDINGNLISRAANSVIHDKCSHNHAEMNAIYQAEKILNTYDLSAYNLSLYVTAEPCMMCLGGIMWSGIREIYFGVPSKTVESITGFDEGFKPDWLKEFKHRNITVYGNIEPERGETVLRDYVAQDRIIYAPKRD